MTELIELLQHRATLLRRVREFFAARKVIEVSTSVLSEAAISDPAIESFAVNATPERYLRTSPEFAMKRLLCAGAPDIFELGPVFRQGESGRWHNPEFTLLEWYRHGYSMQTLIAEVLDLLRHSGVAGCEQDVLQVTYADAFQQVLDIDVVASDAHSLGKVAEALGAAPDSELDKDQWLEYLFATQVRSALSDHGCWVLTHYPASQAALARLDPDDPRFALRFEVFLGAIEIANGFQELQDAREQSNRFPKDNEIRSQRGQATRPVDENFLHALSNGMPACSGVALGIDRLLMCLHDLGDIRSGLAWPWHES